jgi:hypothetical protein
MQASLPHLTQPSQGEALMPGREKKTRLCYPVSS